MIAGLKVTSEERVGCCLLSTAGDLDLAHSRALEVALIRHTSVDLPLVLDLSGIQFVDSSGLYVLLRANHEFAGAGQRLIVVGSSAVVRLVELAGAQHVLALSDSVGEALQALGVAPALDARPASEP